MKIKYGYHCDIANYAIILTS